MLSYTVSLNGSRLEFDTAEAFPDAAQLPEGAIVVAIRNDYCLKSNTWLRPQKEDRVLARGVFEDKKQSHQNIVVWMLPGDRIFYNRIKTIGGQKFRCEGYWEYDGQCLFRYQSSGADHVHLGAFRDPSIFWGVDGLKEAVAISPDFDIEDVRAAWAKSVEDERSLTKKAEEEIRRRQRAVADELHRAEQARRAVARPRPQLGEAVVPPLPREEGRIRQIAPPAGAPPHQAASPDQLAALQAKFGKK